MMRIVSNPKPHVSEIYDALEEDREAYRAIDPEASEGDPVAVLAQLTDRFAVGMMTAGEYDLALRRAIGLSGQGSPVR